MSLGCIARTPIRVADLVEYTIIKDIIGPFEHVVTYYRKTPLHAAAEDYIEAGGSSGSGVRGIRTRQMRQRKLREDEGNGRKGKEREERKKKRGTHTESRESRLQG